MSRGDVIAAHADGIRVDHVFLDKDRHTGRTATHVDAGRAQLLLVLDQRGDARDIGRGGQPRQFQVTALDAMGQVLDRLRLDRQHVHVAAQLVADLPARVDQPRTVIQHEIHRLRVQHLAPRTEIRHVASRQNTGHVLFVHRRAHDLCLAGQTIGPRLGTRKGRDDMIHPDAGHLLRRLHGGTNGALGGAHVLHLAETDPARARRCRADHAEPGLPRQRPDAVVRRVRPVKAQHETGHLGRSHVQDRHHAALHRRAPHVPHRPL